MKHLDSKGFGAIEVILTVVIIGVIGGVGYYVYHSKHNSSPNNNNVSSNSTSNSKSTANTGTTSTKTTDQKSYTVAANSGFNYDVTFNAPKDWSITNDPNAVELTSPDYKTTSGSAAITSGAKLVVMTDKAAYVDPSKSTETNLLAEIEAGYGTPPVSKQYTTVAGHKAIHATVNYGGVNNTDEVAFYVDNDKLVTIQLSYNIKASNPYPSLMNTVTTSMKLQKTQ